MSSTHDHGGRHGHGGSHAHGGRRGRLVAVLGLTSTVLVVQVVGAVVTGSLALLADAGHLLTDVGGVGLALLAALLASRPPTPSRTWGFQRAEVLAAFVQATALLAVGAFVLIEAVRRLIEPVGVASGAMGVFGAIGLVANVAAVAVLAGSRTADLNLRAVFLEVASDALGSLAVIGAAIVISLTGWARADPVASLAIGVLIVPRTVHLLRETVVVLLESTPPGLDLAHVRTHILEVAHILDVHDVHATLVATGLPVLTAHVVVDDECFHDGHVPRLLDALQTCLQGHFDVEHSTFQFEPASHAEHERARHA